MKSRVVGNYCTPYGGSPGLVVMEGDSCAFICCKNLMFEKTKINEKEAGDGQLKNYCTVLTKYFGKCLLAFIVLLYH